jgi:hypothetical protein
MSLREQFEAWLDAYERIDSNVFKAMFDAYQAGHAASGCDELLEAVDLLYSAIDSCVDLTPEVLMQARLVIKKARGET